MAYSSTTNWDVRLTGNDSNGGAFDTASSGTDYSQQDTAQITYTDLVIGATNTQLTSAGNPFTSAHVGNMINITAGTGFTTGRYQVVSVASSVATMDRAVGTASSTGGAGKLGGALATPDAAYNSITSSNSGTGTYSINNTIWIKAGTYTRTTTLDLSASGVTNPGIFIGYQTSHGDRGTKPLITTATNSTDLVKIGGSNVTFSNLSFSNSAGTRAKGFQANSNFTALTLEACIVDGFTLGIDGSNSTASALSCQLYGTEIKNCSSDAVQIFFSIKAFDCYIHDNAGIALKKTSNQDFHVVVVNCILARNSKGVDTGTSAGESVSVSLKNTVLHGNVGDGAYMAAANGNDSPLAMENCIIYGNGGYGIHITTGGFGINIPLLNRNNAYGSNSSGHRSGLSAGTGDVTLTADPFTNSSAGDYSLNATAVGGAACKSAGYQWGA